MTCKKYNKIIMTHRKTSFGRPSITETVTVTVTFLSKTMFTHIVLTVNPNKKKKIATVKQNTTLNYVLLRVFPSRVM